MKKKSKVGGSKLFMMTMWSEALGKVTIRIRRPSDEVRRLLENRNLHLLDQGTEFAWLPTQFFHLLFQHAIVLNLLLELLKQLCVFEQESVPAVLGLECSDLQGLHLGLEGFEVLTAGRTRVLLLDVIELLSKIVCVRSAYAYVRLDQQAPS